MRKALSLFLLSGSFAFLSCGNYNAPSGTSGGKVTSRAFVSQDVSAGNIFAGLVVIDAQLDAGVGQSSISAGATPGMMVVTPNRNQTLVFSPSDNMFSIIDNASQSNVGQVTLPGPVPGLTESFVVSPDSLTAYVAVPRAPVSGQPQGAVEVVGLSSGKFTAEIDIPAVRYLSMSPNGNRILAFSDSPDTQDAPCTPQVPCFLFVITPSNIGTGKPVVAPVPGFDHPVQASFSSDDNTAYVVNCGAECGGNTASVQKLDLTQTQCLPFGVCLPVPVLAASVAVVDGTTMYLAGTPVPASPCTGQQTQATSCGLLTVFDLQSMSVTNSGIVITDGYHNRVALGANGQLFVGARTCTEISLPNPTNEVRGCLSIYNTQTGAVVIPPANGNATGLQPIATRTVVYVVQGGELAIYDTAIDKLQPTQIDIAGEAIDVKTVDF